MIALVIAVIVAILAVIITKNDPSPVAVVPDPPTNLTRNDNMTN